MWVQEISTQYVIFVGPTFVFQVITYEAAQDFLSVCLILTHFLPLSFPL